MSDGPPVDWHSDYEWWAAWDDVRSFSAECEAARAIARARRQIAWQIARTRDPWARAVLARMAAEAAFGPQTLQIPEVLAA